MSKKSANFLSPKLLAIGALILVVIAVPVFIFARREKPAEQNTEDQPTKKKKVSRPVNEIPVEERPYVLMTPTQGREIDVTVKTVNKEANELEFLAEYQYGTSLGGNENAFDLTKGLPATKQFALYSRSAGGKTSYEEDVKGGTLTLKFANPNDYWLKQDWAYYDRVNAKSSTKTSSLQSRDEKFELDLGSTTGLSYVIIYNSPGYPKSLPGTAQSDLYTFQYAGSLRAATAEVSIEMNGEGSGTIYHWDGSEWQEAETSVSGTTATARVPVAEAYIVVSN